MAKKIVLWILVICCMVMIFSFSAQTSEESNELSGSLLDRIIRLLAVNASEETIAFLSVFIRKVAHFSIYALLGGLIFLLVREGYGVRGKGEIVIPVVASGVYAVFDEFHQLFVSGRSGQLLDVFIDTLGAVTSTLLLFTIYMFSARRKK